ncbi:MAG: 2-oxoacid:ferredoxin oxidoreductase subunit beta [Gemmatimonas sp.]|nr:2-oxoacid:ferredoxin oxidoreductase subunit beta [Gemmatimonas sp.]
MTYILKPKVRHPGLPTNALGLTARDYEGAMSTLCAGCGHDSVTAAVIQAVFELDLPPHRVAKLSGIGCSSKTPTYFLGQAHGFNAVHGRMPAIAAGASAANRDLIYLGVSGDGDSLSIGLGHLCHAIRRNVRMLYLIENNGVYGLTKGQFSASADVGTRSKRGEENRQEPIDPIHLALTLGVSFAARGFSGDKVHLVPILKAALQHDGFALVDVISPCVAFNDHVGSTKSYLHTREHAQLAVLADFIPPAAEITASVEPGGVRSVTMHDGSTIQFRQVPDGYDPTNRESVENYVRERQRAGEVAMGLLYVEPGSVEMNENLGTVDRPLCELPYEELCPGSARLEEIQLQYR